MFGKSDIARIKTDLEGSLGQKVKLTSKKGRKKSVIRQGVIESTYPSIFVVKLDMDDEFVPNSRRVSYSYTDVLTKAVELVLCENGEDTAVQCG